MRFVTCLHPGVILSDSSSPNIPSILLPTICSSNLPVPYPTVCATQWQFRSFIHSSRTIGDVVKIMPRSNLLSHRVTLESLLLAYLDLSASNYSQGTKSYCYTGAWREPPKYRRVARMVRMARVARSASQHSPPS